MRFSVTLAFAAIFAATSVTAQRSSLNDLPTCANSCAQTAASNAKCTLSDSSAPCLCFSNFRNDVVQCSQSACTVEDRGSVQGVMDTFCNGVSPPITGPSNSTSAAGSSTKPTASSSASSNTSKVTTSTIASTTRANTPTPPGTQVPATTTASPVSTTIAGSITFGSGLQTSVVIVTGSATTDDGGAVPTAPATNGAQALGRLGGLGAVIMVVLSIAGQMI